MKNSLVFETKLAVEPSLAKRETSDFAPLPRDRFALIQLTYVGAACAFKSAPRIGF
jgi:hypothetical protein